jgi:flagellar hook-associated protein 1 FlgK
MDVLEGIFNENSEYSLSGQFNKFWGAWNDLSNSPSGLPERNVVYEMGSLLAQTFRETSGDLDLYEREINLALEAEVEKINELTSQIATLNGQIIGIEVTGNANDLRDQRNMAVRELSEHIGVTVQEDEDGNVSVGTTTGYVLVNRSETYELTFDSNEIKWQGSSGLVTITEGVVGGNMGALVDTRDAIIPKFKADLNELGKSVIWEVNKIHTQGVGLQTFSSVTGTYAATDSTEEMGTSDSGLTFYDSIEDGGFNYWLYDDLGNVVGGGPTAIPIDKDPGGTSLDALAASITAIHANITATVSSGKLQITAANNFAFAFSDDTSNVLAALGINAFFTGANALDMGVNSALDTNKALIAAARVDSTGEFASGDNTNALSIANLQYTDVTIKRWTYERGSSPSSIDTDGTLDNYLHYLVGEIGIESQTVNRTKEYAQVVVDQLNATRDNISGVSLDEEMTLLIQYQHAYRAAAKMISAADEMLSTVLEVI